MNHLAWLRDFEEVYFQESAFGAVTVIIKEFVALQRGGGDRAACL